MNILRFEEVDSTNSFLRQLSKEKKLDDFTVVSALSQKCGRGQGKNKWISEKGKNLTFSIFIHPKIEKGKEFVINQAFSLGIKKTLDKMITGTSIKWPNDIYYGNRKLCGILIENEYIGNTIASSVVGIGLNVNQTSFTKEASRPISLIDIIGKETDTDCLLECSLGNIFRLYSLMNEKNYDLISEKYKDSLFRKNGYHLFYDKNGFFNAKIAGIDLDGKILLETEKGESRAYSYKEVMWGIEE